MPLPAVEELIVEDDAVYDQYHEARYCQCQSHTHQSSEGGDERPVRPPEEGADDDENHVEYHQGKEDGVGQEPLLGEPSPHALGAAVDIGDDEQKRHHRSEEHTSELQ